MAHGAYRQPTLTEQSQHRPPCSCRAPTRLVLVASAGLVGEAAAKAGAKIAAAPLRSRVRVDKWDVQAWEGLGELLLAFADRPDTLGEQRDLYEELLAQFPTAGLFWKTYAEVSMKAKSPDVKNIFSRSLLSCPYLDLWKAYLTFIKDSNKGRGNEGMAEMRQAYEFTLDHIGQDFRAGDLWREYIAFVAGPGPGTPAYQALWGDAARPGQESSERLRVLRSAYQRALAVPSRELDALWRQYEQLELQNSSKVFARRVLDEQRPRYQASKAAQPARQRLLGALELDVFALPPGQGGFAQQQMHEAWQAYLDFEMRNPQRLEAAALAARVLHAYEQALMVLLHYPEAWLEYAGWHQQQDPPDANSARQVLVKGRERLPSCLLLHCAAADLEEQQGRLPAARAVYEDLVHGRTPVPAEPEAGEIPEERAPLQLPAELGTLAWLQFMALVRRTDSVKAARQVFLRALKDPAHGWQVYAAAALMEWRNDRSNEAPPKKIFELGAKKFLGVPDFVLSYIDFQLGLGDIANARATFERALTVTPGDQQGPLWDRYVQLEYHNGAPGALQSVERRRGEALAGQQPSMAGMLRLQLLKHSALGLWPCADQDQEHLKRVLGDLPALPAPAVVPAADGAVALAGPVQVNGFHGGPGVEDPIKADPGAWTAAGPTLQPAQPAYPAGNMAGAVGVIPAAGPQPGPAPYGGAHAPIRPAVDLHKQLPGLLGDFISRLPPARSLQGPHPDVDQVLDGIASFDFSPASMAAADAAVLRQHPGANSSGPHAQQPYLMGLNHQDAGPMLGGGGGGYGQAPGYQAQPRPDMHGMKRKHEPAGSFGAPLDDVFKRRRQRGMRTPPDS